MMAYSSDGPDLSSGAPFVLAQNQFTGPEQVVPLRLSGAWAFDFLLWLNGLFERSAIYFRNQLGVIILCCRCLISQAGVAQQTI